MTLRHAVETYLKLDHSPQTIKTYSSRLHALLAHMGDRPLKSITYAEVVDYCYSFKTRLKPGTYFQYQIVLKVFFKWCVEVGFLSASPAAPLKVHKSIPDPVDRAIPAAVLDAMYEAVRRKEYNAIRDYAILRLIDESACRRVGVANLQLSRLDLENMSAVTREKGGRFVPIFFGPETVRALQSWLGLRPVTNHDYVFTSRGQGHPPLKPEAVSRMIERLSASIAGRAYGPHSIRHYAAEEMVMAGEAPNIVQHKLNHLHQRTTVDHYYRNDNSLVQLATLRRAARRSRKSSESPKIIALFDEGEEHG